VHRKHKKKYLNILLIPDDDSASKNLKIRYSYIRLLVFLTIILFIILLYALISYSRILQSALNSQAIENENMELRIQLGKVKEIEAELNLLKSYNQRVRTTLQGYVDVVNPDPGIIETTDNILIPDKKRSIFTSFPLKEPVSGFISQNYNWPVHNGVDIVAAEGTPILATADGIVLFSGWTTYDGYTVLLQHSDGFFSFYKHNQKNLVSPHDRVNQGDVIALLGNSGEKSSGPHVHFEIWRNGLTLDPMQYITDLK